MCDVTVVARRRQLPQHVGKPRGRRRARLLLAQEPAQQIARARRVERAKGGAVERAAVEGGSRVDPGEFVEQRSRFRLVAGRAHQYAGIAWRDRPERRNEIRAKRIAAIAMVGIAFVVDVVQAMLREVSVERCARNGEKRPQPPDAAHKPRRRHGGQAAGAGAAQQLQQQRLGLVVGVMRQQHRGCAPLARERFERLVTRRSRSSLDADARAARNTHLARRASNPVRRAQRGAEARPGVGVAGQPMMDVQGDDLAARGGGDACRRVEQRDGIATARQRNADAPAVGQRLREQIRDGRPADRGASATQPAGISLNRP